MICCSRPVQHGTVLTAVKAEPSGWPTASLDPGSGRRRSTRTKSRPTEITQQDPPIQVSTVSGDCRFPAPTAAAKHCASCSAPGTTSP
jgi:hypothetical protein